MRWYPIETAPKDVEVLTAAITDRTIIVRNARWVNEDEWLDDGVKEESGWWSFRTTLIQERLRGRFTPKFWAPMPEGLPE